MALDKINVLIHECSFHNSLWPSSTTRAILVQARMLGRSLIAAQTFARTLQEVPPATLYRLAFPIWSSWFYSTVLVVKHILLRSSGESASSPLQSLPNAVGDFLPRHADELASVETFDISTSRTQADVPNTITSVEEAEFIAISESFLEKMEAAVADSVAVDRASLGKPFLAKVATLQGALLSSICKKTARQDHAPTTPIPPFSNPHQEGPGFTAYDTTSNTSVYNDYRQYQGYQSQPLSSSVQNAEPPDFTYLDNAAPSGYDPTQQGSLDDLVWDMVMDESSNMFTFGSSW
jgi:hypothetical protein